MKKIIPLILLFFTNYIYADNKVTIDLENQGQQIVMMGTDMERSANFLHKASNKNDIIQWVFKDISGMDYLRVVFDKHQELEKGNKNFEFYNLQIKSMQEIKTVQPKIIFWATLRTDYDGYGEKIMSQIGFIPEGDIMEASMSQRN